MRLHHVLTAATAAVAAVALAAVPASAAAQKTVSAPGDLVFVSNHGDYDLWTVNADGSARAQLTKSSQATTTAWNSGKTEWAPVFSPDRTWLAYQSSRSGTPDVVVRNVSTGVYRVLAGRSDTSEAPAGWYVGSDGLRVAYVTGPTTGGGPYVLRSVRLDGGGDVQLLGASYDTRSLAATPTTVYVSALAADGSVSLWSFPADTDPAAGPISLTRVTTGRQDINVAVAPAGDVIFMRRAADGSGDLVSLPQGTVESATTPVVPLLHQGFTASNPEVSPDGSRIAYSSSPDSVVAHSDVYVAPLARGSDNALHAGTSHLVVGDPSYQDSQPTWSR